MEKNEIMLGSGEVYMMEFEGDTLPEHDAIETDDNNVGYCNSGFKIDYKPKKYDVKNQYGRFGLDFGDKETSINAELQGIEKIKNFLAEFEQEL